jgi:hypothetical protein
LPLQDAFKQEKLLREKYNISLVIETPAFLSFSQLQVNNLRSNTSTAHHTTSHASTVD